jgi:mono/diheme cytochrome c family protein
VLIANVNNGTVQRLIYDTNSVAAPLPPTLAETGAFTNLTTLTNQTQALGASSGLVPYDINVHFWSDNARKSRWFLIATNLKIGFRPEGNWSFPAGQAWVKHFDLELTNGVASSARRLETRFLIKNSNGVYGVTYRWGNSLTNATLVPEAGLDEEFVINDGGTMRTQVWHYPSRTECNSCHSPVAGFALGFNTVQMNRDFGYTGGVSNQIAFLSVAGVFSNTVTELNSLRALAPVTNAAASLEWRVRSYLAANCAQCHQPGGAALGFWNANISNFTVDANIINGPLNNNFGNQNARVVVPTSVVNSMLHTRLATRGPTQMPPLATSLIDSEAVSLVSSWINSGAWTNFTAQPNVSIAATNSATAINFIQPANRAYRVEFATILTNPVPWQFLDVPQNRPFYPATSKAVSIIDSTNSSQKFYRVRLSTP